jgi:hypothetical protein
MDSVEGNMTVSKETLRGMVEEMDLIPMSDEELEQALPEIQALVDAMSELLEVDLVETRVSHVFRADPTT